MGTSEPNAQHDGDDERSRLIRLEEHVGYNERSIEELSEEIAELGKRLAALTRRMDGMEGRLSQILEPNDDPGSSRRS